MVRLTVDYDNEAKVWLVRTSDLFGVHAESDTLDALCGKLPAVVSDLVEANRNQAESRKANTCYCSFCGKSQHEVPKLIAGSGSSRNLATQPAKCMTRPEGLFATSVAACCTPDGGPMD
jgi:hypothetical protein